MPLPYWSCNVIQTLKFVLHQILLGAQQRYVNIFSHKNDDNPLIL